MGQYGTKSIVNHFEHHSSLTEKDQLYQYIARSCEMNHKSVIDYLPITYVIDFTQKSKMESALDKFTLLFNTIEKHKHLDVESLNKEL